MKRTSASLVIAFALGCLVTASTVPGCSKPANRTLTIFQLQSTETYDGQFLIDVSELPSGAIKAKAETGGPGDPVTRIELNSDYGVEVVLRLASQ